MKIKKITFKGEQDGSSEQELKNAFYAYFSENAGVDKSFLARVTYNNQPEQNIALCLVAPKANKEEIVQNIGRLFRNMFGADQHLDILFIDKKQEKDASKVCKSFFER